jgi:thiol-disulfide isomerase/thioredoxin
MTTKQSQSSGSRTGLIIGLVGGGVVLLLVLAVIMGTNEVNAETGEPTLEGTALPAMPQNNPIDISANGLPIPNVVGEDFDGEQVTIDRADNSAKAILFLAHWCPHCQAEVPRVQAWINQTGGVEGVDMYAVATSINSARSNYPPSSWLEREGWTSPIIRDTKDNLVLNAYGSGGFPYWVFVNADGTVAARASGEMPIEQLQAFLESLEQ